MRALLLAGGYGTRLRPLTDTIPKCLVPIKGVPLLEIWLRRLSAENIGPFLINTHHLADSVESFISVSHYRDKIKLVHEKNLLGTAGTLAANLSFFDGDDGLLIHADNYCMADLSAFQLAHSNRPKGCLLTMLTFRTQEPSSCGIVELDGNGVVTQFHEKVSNPPSDVANGAVYILSEELLEMFNNEFSTMTDFSTEVLPKLLGRIYIYRTNEAFIDIGTPANYKLANTMPIDFVK